MAKGSYKTFGPPKYFETITDRYKKDQILKLKNDCDDVSIQKQLNLTVEQFDKYIWQLKREGRIE